MSENDAVTSRGWRHLLVPGVLALVAVLLVGVQSRHHDDIPVPSETAQLDYLLALPHVPARGDLVSDEAVPPGTTADQLPEGPYSLAGGTPPAYYVVTAVIARTAAAVTGWTPLTVGRALGALWLALFLLAAYALARDVGAPALPAGAAAVAVAATTSLSTSASYLGSDTAGAAAGGLVLLMAWRYDGGRRALWWLVAACALAGLTKLSAVTAVAAAVIMLLVRRGVAPRGDKDPLPLGSWRATVLGAGAAATAFLVPAVAWLVRTEQTAHLATVDVPNYASLVVDHVDWGLSSEGLLYPWLDPVLNIWVSPLLADHLDWVLTYVIAALLPLGVLAAAFTGLRRPDLVGLGAGLAILMILGPFAFEEVNFRLNGVAVPVEPRYGLGLLAGQVAVVAWLLRDRAASLALVALVALSAVNLLT